MNQILIQYFNRLKELSGHEGIEYFNYERDPSSRMPYSVHLRFTDYEAFQRNSWGSGDNKDEAFGKALMEMIERIYFSGLSSFQYQNVFGLFKNKTKLLDLSHSFQLPTKFLHPANTNGIAIHISKKKAIESAIYELIERHTILYGIANSIGPKSKIVKQLSPDKIGEFFIWESPLETFTVVGSLTDQVGSYFSSGCDKNLDLAVSKAEYELNSFLYLKDDFDSDFCVIKDDIQSINRYHRYSGDKQAMHFLNNSKPGKIPELSKKHFYFSDIPLPSVFCGLQALPCVRVIHPDVQQLFFDNWGHEYLNPRIFKQDHILPAFPHFIA